MIDAEHYSHKTTDYYQVAQKDVLEFVAEGNNRILEIGCAEGHTGASLKAAGKASEVYGIELVPEIAERARLRLDNAIAGNIETMDLPYEAGYFDYVLATDVLEHLTRPEVVLERLKPYIKPRGVIVASVPNMRHFRLIWELVVKGDWQYADAGPMDRTHMRFFTKKSFSRLFSESGYDVVKTSPVLLSKAASLNRLTVGLVEEFLAFRYYCISRKP